MSIFSLIITCLAFSQPTTPPVDELFIVEADNTLVRCGAAENYYAFQQVPVGSIIHVVDNKVNWGRVPATGPVFADSWGWIRQPVNEPGRFTVLTDGSGKTLDTTAVFAADLSNPSPQKAWRQVCMLPMDTSVEIIEQTTGEIDGKSFNFYKVRLPGAAEGWINMANLRPADPKDLDLWTGGVSLLVDETIVLETESGIEIVEEVREEVSTPSTEPSYLARYLKDRDNQIVDDSSQPETKLVEEKIILIEPISHQKRFFNTLETIYASIPATDMSRQMMEKLVDGYRIVATEDVEIEPEAALMATVRIRQLEMAAVLREQNRSLEDLDIITRLANNDVSIIRQVLDEPVEYAVLGRLNVSSVFTGTDGRPTFYRVEDPMNGRTLAYLEPSGTADVTSMIGQWIGVVGKMEFDSRWRIQVIEPERVDLVAATLN
ncbi:MAG: hypothetical protein CMJ40_08925 [Phycisphaerae bacterium]|nr:hypothetical protein [Phycisphaerae bacterium]|tara:strand:- start:2492 stop:3790 length:1299 start_codon:yes stop_codon:yes gene_type:complete